MTYTIVGVTGHIDHGKSTLVRMLTGIDTDTLPEEKRRGITIDLGFASFRNGIHRFALIDAPGHQRYIGNLLAGVSAIDVGLLVVAADQGIQQQTMEHASIVRGLDVKNLIVVISRIDLVDAFAVEQLSEELECFLSDLGFNELPIVPVSCISGEGIERLKSLLCEYAIRLADINEKPFKHVYTEARVPIDRVFSVEGRGVVVAGSIWNGEVRIGDMLQLAGTNESFRVREMEVHGENVASSQVGLRTAFNLVGSGSDKLCRGVELVSPGSYGVCEQLVVGLEIFADATEIRCPCTIQMHTATNSCTARILGVRRLVPGTSLVAIVNPAEPIVATYMQACLFRSPYPVGSFAAGRVLAAINKRGYKNRDLIDFGQSLLDACPADRLIAWVNLVRELDVTSRWISYQIGIPNSALDDIVRSIVDAKKVIRLGDILISRAAINASKKCILNTLANRTSGEEDSWMLEKSLLEKTLPSGSATLLAWSLEQLIGEGLLIRINGMVAMGTEGAVFTKKQRVQMEQILAMFSGTRKPPALSEISERLKLSRDSATSLLRFAVQQGLLIDLGHGLHISSQIFDILCRELSALLQVEQHLTVGSIRNAWQVSRKYAIPLLEFCDSELITVRSEDHRCAGPRLDVYCEAANKVESFIEKK